MIYLAAVEGIFVSFCSDFYFATLIFDFELSPSQKQYIQDKSNTLARP